jgi:ABC-type thiamine transport system substrate-binding protein
MEIIFALILTFSTARTGGMTTVGYYDTFEKCEVAGKNIEKKFEEKLWTREMDYFCVPVDKISQ